MMTFICYAAIMAHRNISVYNSNWRLNGTVANEINVKIKHGYQFQFTGHKDPILLSFYMAYR